MCYQVLLMVYVNTLGVQLLPQAQNAVIAQSAASLVASWTLLRRTLLSAFADVTTPSAVPYQRILRYLRHQRSGYSLLA